MSTPDELGLVVQRKCIRAGCRMSGTWPKGEAPICLYCRHDIKLIQVERQREVTRLREAERGCIKVYTRTCVYCSSIEIANNES